MRIRVKDLIEELQRFPPDDVVEFEYVRVTNQKHDDGCGRHTTVKDVQTLCNECHEALHREKARARKEMSHFTWLIGSFSAA